MKNLFFLISSILATLSLHSQDIFTSGFITNSEGAKVAAVLKNGAVLFRLEQYDKDLYSPAMAIDTTNDDIYWSVNSNPINSISDGYGCVMKNGEILLDNVLGTCINDISLDGGDIYSGGFMNDIYDATAAVWKNGDITPIYSYCADKRRSQVLGIDAVDGVVYACGYYEENNLRYGCVWVNGDLYASYPYCTVFDITYHDGDIYYLVNECYTTVYKSGEMLYDLYHSDNLCNDVYDIKVTGDDVYTVGCMSYIDCFVWKNADNLYIHPIGREAAFRACYFYGQSIYYVGYDHEDNGIIFKDGEQLYSIENYAFYDVWVRPNNLSVDEIETDDESVVYIYNIFGELVKTVYSNINSLDINDLSAGIYVAKSGKSVVKFMK